MSNQILYYLMGISGGLFAIILIAYLIIQSKSNKGDMKKIRQLREGTKQNKYSMEILYQRLYNFYVSVPVFKRYVLKIRRKLEVIHMQDEYKTRRQASAIITKAFLIIFVVTIFALILVRKDPLLLSIILLYELFLIETLMAGMVDKYDTKLLKQQVEFFAEIRHAYHEFNMVEEAIYEVSQNDELEVSIQGQRIYEVLTSDDPETELEKYYDVAPNAFLKEFAGISYLTREFGDRTDKDGASLYLKNLNNITEEMQLEILKRDKIDYVFQSLSVIAVLPVLFMSPLKGWSINNFAFTAQFYEGKGGLFMQIALVILTFICYYLIRKIKDTGSIKVEYKDQNKVWQMKLYNKPIIKKIMDYIIPKKNTKEERILKTLLKDAASKQRIETVYVNKVTIALVVMLISIFLFLAGHKIAINYVYTEPTSDYNLLSTLGESDRIKGMQVTEAQNEALDEFRGKSKVTKEDIIEFLAEVDYYKDATDKELEIAAERVQDKLKVINGETFKWFELLIAFIFGYLGFCSPTWMLILQKKIRALEMENEVMEYQTIILMLMKIERVNVEMILEWLERYSNIFREPISRCVNNYEAGAWEALEELKQEISFPQLIQIVESLQAAVEKIPIREAFDELDNEREYYKEKRKESNERLIKRKGMIGKVVGFAPMIGLFVGYLIIPLVAIGFSAMTQSFASIDTTSI